MLFWLLESGDGRTGKTKGKLTLCAGYYETYLHTLNMLLPLFLYIFIFVYFLGARLYPKKTAQYSTLPMCYHFLDFFLIFFFFFFFFFFGIKEKAFIVMHVSVAVETPDVHAF